MIGAQNLSKSFGRVAALRHVDLAVQRGERVALLGGNGAGKTTLLRILATLAKPSSGTLTIAGFDALRQPHSVRSLTGVVGHQSLLYGDLTATENLRFYARLYCIEPAEQRIDRALELVGLRERRAERVAILSRGQQQRLSLARAVLHNPAILLLDEPDTGLDADGLNSLERLMLGEGLDQRPTVMFSSHQTGWATRMADRTLALEAGRLA